MQNIGRKIKMAMAENGMTQEKLAGKVRLKQAAISKIIKGINNPTLETLDKISTALKKPVSYFIDNANNASGDFMVTEKNYGVVGHKNKGDVYVDTQLEEHREYLVERFEKLEKEIEKNIEKSVEMLGLKLDLILEKLNNLKK